MSIRTEIIQRAFRMLNKVGIGQSLDNDEAAEAMTAFQDMILTLPAVGVGGPLTPVVISEAYTAGENEAITNTSGGAVVITLPTTVTDPWTGETRPPLPGAIVQINGAASPEIHIYVDYLASWKEITGLTQNSAVPFGPAHNEGLAAMLALRIAGPNTKIPDNVVLMAERGDQDLYRRFPPDLQVAIDTAMQGRIRRTGERVL